MNFWCNPFPRVLESLGVSGAANLLRKRDFSDLDGLLEPQTIQAISFYFQLLNLVEEHGSGRSSRQREKELGADAEPGKWGRYLKLVRDAGFSEEEIRKKLARSKWSQFLPSIQPKQNAGRFLAYTGKLSG